MSKRHRINNHDYQTYKQKVKQDVLSKIKFKPTGPKNPTEVLLRKAMDITTAMRQHIKPILQAGGAATEDDRKSLRATIMTLYLQALDVLSKEEKLELLAILHTDLMMETIEADPYGHDKPDLMSGI